MTKTKGKSFIKKYSPYTLPIFVLIIVPFFILFDFKTEKLRINLFYPALQLGIGAIFCLIGLYFFILTVSTLSKLGKGTLAPWDSTSKLVTEGVYAYTRNPMISSVITILIGETILTGSEGMLMWCAIFFIINTFYFKLSEEPDLVKRFGDEYIEYGRNVPMWFFRLKPWTKKD
jgi:protein-S-isoprenylcysteine O-methyltransferase Ste14